MLQSDTIRFLQDISEHNDKLWFDKNRNVYLSAKKDFENLVDRLLNEMSAFEPAFKEQSAKDCIFRIFRDVRFSRNKTPYKTHFGAYLSKGGKKYEGAGYYLHIEPGNKSFAAGGLWMPEPALLKKIRQEIDYNFGDFQSILQDSSFQRYYQKLEGEKLKTIPQGYDRDNPAIEYLRMKSFTVGYVFNDEDVQSQHFIQKATAAFKAVRPLIQFFNRASD